MQIPMITYFCVTVGLALIIALCLLHTWFVAWMYVLERNRMAAARARGDTELARVNGGESLLQPPLGAFFESVGRALTRPWVKVLVLALALGLVGTAPYGISQVVPGYGPRDFVKGCGVFCDPSYLLDFVEEQEAGFVPAPLPVTLMVRGFDLNAQQEELQLLLSRLAAHGAGTQSSATSVAEVGARPANPQGGEHHTCPTSCMDTSNGLGPVSCAPPPPPPPAPRVCVPCLPRLVRAPRTHAAADARSQPAGRAAMLLCACHAAGLAAFCGAAGSAARGGVACGRTAGLTAQHVQTFLSAVPFYVRDVVLPANLQSAVLPAMRLYYPMRNYEKTEDSMTALQATNEIIDESSLDDVAFGDMFTAFSMCVRAHSTIVNPCGMCGVAMTSGCPRRRRRRATCAMLAVRRCC
jgi:hypothetical protein